MVGRPRGLENVQYKAKEREEFFHRLDRSGTIEHVAVSLHICPLQSDLAIATPLSNR